MTIINVAIWIIIVAPDTCLSNIYILPKGIPYNNVILQVHL